MFDKNADIDVNININICSKELKWDGKKAIKYDMITRWGEYE